MKIHTHPIILSILLFCFAAGAFFVGHMALSYATFQATENFCVLLDAGHGGADPGKVSASGIKALIKESKINCAVSIHQNSFPDSSSCGAQVFYHPNYPESKRLAGLIQAQMHSLTGIENHRKIKANTDYYLLRDNDTPTVIAEVCFLSNPSEAAMIAEETIQEKAAFQIAMGIMQFLHVHPTNSPSILSET